MNTAIGFSLLLVTGLAAADRHCVTTIPLPGGARTFETRVAAISGNGVCVGGNYYDIVPIPFLLESSTTFPATFELTAIDRLGRSVVGFTRFNNGYGGVATAVLLTQTADGSTRTLTLPPPSGYGFGISGYGAKGISQDGSVVAGFSTVNGQQRAIRWRLWRDTNGGDEIDVTNLGTLQGGNYSWAGSVSGDGTTIAGITNTATNQNTQAFRWTAANGMIALGLPEGATYSEPAAVNADGSVIVGNMFLNGVYKAFRWTPEFGTQDIGLPSGFDDGWALAVSGDGTFVVGYCQTRQPPTIQRAFVWTYETGAVLLGDFLQANGFDLATWTLYRAHAISADGAVVAGDGANIHGNRSFVIRDIRPRACPSDLDGDGFVNAADIALLLLDFGSTDSCAPDLDGSNQVDAADIALLLLDFGSCP